MSWMIIPHLAVFNVMITLGELARLCNCGLVLHELRNPPRKKTHQFRRFKSQPSGTTVAKTTRSVLVQHSALSQTSGSGRSSSSRPSETPTVVFR